MSSRPCEAEYHIRLESRLLRVRSPLIHWIISGEDFNPEMSADPGIIPLGRFGEVEEVIAIAVMLVRSRYITGQGVNVNGGIYMS